MAKRRVVKGRRSYPERYVCEKCGATFYSKVGVKNHENYRRGHRVVSTTPRR